MKRKCFICLVIVDDKGPTPKGYDNDKAESSCICPKCAKEAKKQIVKGKKI